MNNILLRWIKLRFLNTNVTDERTFAMLLNKFSEGMCTFEVTTSNINVFDEKQLVGTYDYVINGGFITSIKHHV